MAEQTASDKRYGQLGLREGASQEEVELAYAELQTFLNPGRVPPVLKAWANKQRRLAEEAYGVLQEAAPGHNGAARAHRRRHRGRMLPRHNRRDMSLLGRVWLALRARATPILLGILVGGATLLAVFAMLQQQSGRGAPVTQGAAQSTSPSEQFTPLDTARIAVLKATVERNPADTEALFELGERHFQAGKWQEAIDWFSTLLTLAPQDVHARTDIGTANFNLGQQEQARAAWMEAAALAPDDPQLHYNLGYLYANGQQRDPQAAEREWQQVLTLTQGTELAAVTQRDLDALLQLGNQPLAPR